MDFRDFDILGAHVGVTDDLHLVDAFQVFSGDFKERRGKVARDPVVAAGLF